MAFEIADKPGTMHSGLDSDYCRHATRIIPGEIKRGTGHRVMHQLIKYQLKQKGGNSPFSTLSLLAKVKKH